MFTRNGEDEVDWQMERLSGLAEGASSPKSVLRSASTCNTMERTALVLFDHIEWDDVNLEHATKRVSATGVEPAIWNADRRRLPAPRVPGSRHVSSAPDGGRNLVVIAQVVRDGVRPITAWEAE